MVPVTLLGPFAGSFVDKMNKRGILVWSQILLACSSLLIAYLAWKDLVEVEYLYIAAVFNGIISCFEMPVRQAVISSVVSKEDLPLAIPFQGLTFNLARVVGPAIAAFILTRFNVATCYLVNGISFFALIFATLTVRADLSSKTDGSSPMVELIIEGFKYTWRDKRLKMLFMLETGISFLALFYLAQMPAIAHEMLGFPKEGGGVGIVTTAVGIGAIIALIVTSKTSDLHIKGLLIRTAVTTAAVGLLLLSFAQSVLVAFPILILLGISNVIIFNTCNSLFQQIAPEHLRGRVISMHIWALSGIGPLGIYPFGLLAEHYGLPFSLRIASILTIGVAAWAWLKKVSLEAK
jgi:MFS family permease